MRNKRLFEKIVRKTQPELKQWLHWVLKNNGYEVTEADGFLYAEGTVPVMLMAHLDTVHKLPVSSICWDKDYNVVMSPEGIGGDDRCGVYMILRLIRDLHCHVLFCEDEEIGGVGARAFADSGILPQVNYLIEFDRKGWNDAVFYDCANDDFTAMIESYGFKENWGTFSDICTVAPAVGVAAVNLSSGYYDQHTLHESVSMRTMTANIARVTQLIRENQDTRYEYIEDRSFRRYGNYPYGNDYYNWRDDYDDRWQDDWSSYYRSQYGSKDDKDHLRLMPLDVAGEAVVVCSNAGDVEGDFLIDATDAWNFAIDDDENLYSREYDDSWAFLDGPCPVYGYESLEWVEYDDRKAKLCKVDYIPPRTETVTLKKDEKEVRV